MGARAVGAAEPGIAGAEGRATAGALVGRAAAVAGAGAATGRGAAGAGTETTGAGAATGAAADTVGAPPGGKVGSLIVCGALGFGGKLMRTVSFFGWIFAASAGFGGRFGFSSAIKIRVENKLRSPRSSVKPI